MLDFPRWKTISIWLIIILGLVFSIPSMVPEKTVESWKRCLAYALGSTNKVKFEGVAGSTGFKKLPPSVKLDDDFVEKWKESGKYLRQAEPEPDKKAIAEALKNGETVEGARLETGTKLYVK